MHSTILHRHPDTPCDSVQQVSASVRIEARATLCVHYLLAGTVDQVRVAEQTHEGDPLWQHTCFELFVGATNDAEYYEFNFSPSGAWTLLGFRDYRDGGPMHVESLKPKITARREEHGLRLDAEVPLEYLPGVHSGVQLSIGLSAVVEEIAGTLSYWALKHPPGQPDFHHADNFAIQLELPAVGDRDQDCAANA
jgi:hypothetical protein